HRKGHPIRPRTSYPPCGQTGADATLYTRYSARATQRSRPRTGLLALRYTAAGRPTAESGSRRLRPDLVRTFATHASRSGGAIPAYSGRHLPAIWFESADYPDFTERALL